MIESNFRELNPKSSATALATEANVLFGEKKYEEAKTNYCKALASLDFKQNFLTDPSTILCNMAQCLLKLKTYRQAVEICNQGLLVDPKNPKIWYSKAAAHYSLGEFDEAVLCLIRGIQTGPSLQAACLKLLQTLRKALDANIEQGSSISKKSYTTRFPNEIMSLILSFLPSHHYFDLASCENIGKVLPPYSLPIYVGIYLKNGHAKIQLRTLIEMKCAENARTPIILARPLSPDNDSVKFSHIMLCGNYWSEELWRFVVSQKANLRNLSFCMKQNFQVIDENRNPVKDSSSTVQNFIQSIWDVAFSRARDNHAQGSDIMQKAFQFISRDAFPEKHLKAAIRFPLLQELDIRTNILQIHTGPVPLIMVFQCPLLERYKFIPFLKPWDLGTLQTIFLVDHSRKLKHLATPVEHHTDALASFQKLESATFTVATPAWRMLSQLPKAIKNLVVEDRTDGVLFHGGDKTKDKDMLLKKFRELEGQTYIHADCDVVASCRLESLLTSVDRLSINSTLRRISKRTRHFLDLDEPRMSFDVVSLWNWFTESDWRCKSIGSGVLLDMNTATTTLTCTGNKNLMYLDFDMPDIIFPDLLWMNCSHLMYLNTASIPKSGELEGFFTKADDRIIVRFLMERDILEGRVLVTSESFEVIDALVILISHASGLGVYAFKIFEGHEFYSFQKFYKLQTPMRDFDLDMNDPLSCVIHLFLQLQRAKPFKRRAPRDIDEHVEERYAAAFFPEESPPPWMAQDCTFSANISEPLRFPPSGKFGKSSFSAISTIPTPENKRWLLARRSTTWVEMWDDVLPSDALSRRIPGMCQTDLMYDTSAWPCRPSPSVHRIHKMKAKK